MTMPNLQWLSSNNVEDIVVFLMKQVNSSNFFFIASYKQKINVHVLLGNCKSNKTGSNKNINLIHTWSD